MNRLSRLVASTKDGDLLGAGNLAEQMVYIYDTIRKSISLAGATTANVVRQQVFIVGLTLEHRPLNPTAKRRSLWVRVPPAETSYTSAGVSIGCEEWAQISRDGTPPWMFLPVGTQVQTGASFTQMVLNSPGTKNSTNTKFSVPSHSK